MSDTSPTDFTAPSAEEIGALLPAYEVHHFIAKGGMGAVYMASQKSLERQVAIKILPRHFGEDAAFRHSFETEAKSMAKLNHPNLISIYDFGQVDGMLYIIMEMVHGKSLYHSAYGKTIVPEEAARITLGICEGLASAHKQGILHRDIKPANILLTPDATPKIGDFGLARPAGDTDSGMSFGTPGYAAPEIIHNPAAVDASTDLFALGVIFYELLTGHLPDKAYSPASSEVGSNPAFDQIIRKATHPTPSLRFRKAEDMAKEIQKALETKKPEQKAVKLMTAKSTPPSSTAKTLVSSSKSIKANSTSSSGTAKTLLTAPKNTKQANKLNTNDTGSGENSQQQTATPPVVNSSSGSNIPFIRNIIIIIALLAAIYIAWEGLQVVREKRAAKQELEDQKRKEQEATAKKERELRLKKKREAKEAQNRLKKNNTPKPNDLLPPKPKPETPLESLVRLRSSLLTGKRDELPKKTIRSGDRARFYISTPMTWHAALRFCERHGGHLPIFSNSNTLLSFASNIEPNQSIWLGAGTAGNKNWCWIDGSPWKMEIRKTSKPFHVSVDDTGVLKPLSGENKLPFFIEWMMDGSTPGTLEKQLQRCALSLNSDTPTYPAGTATYSNRHYLLISFQSEWQTARSMAEASGGNLAVPSNRDESVWISNYLGSVLQKDQHCWIGGIHPAKKSWQWVTGEPWEFANWKQDTPDGDIEEQLACTINHQGQWDDFESDYRLDTFLIEWSNDHKGHTSVKTQTNANTNQLASLRQKCTKLVQGINKKYDTQFKRNISAYETDLRIYQRSLPKGLLESQSAKMAEMQSNYKNNRIPSNLSRKDMPAKLQEILDEKLEKQVRIEKSLETEIQGIQKKYRSALYDALKELKNKGQASRAMKVQEEIDNTDVDYEKFSQYIISTN